MVEDEQAAPLRPLRFAQLEHGEGGAGVGFAPGRDRSRWPVISRQVVFGNEEEDHVEDGLKLRLRVNLPELALAGFLALPLLPLRCEAATVVPAGKPGLPSFFKQIQTFRVTPVGDFLQYLCERCNFAKTQTL